MNIKFNSYTTANNEELLYTGSPAISMLNELAQGTGDLWHSSLDQGYKNCFPELIYQTAVYWWFLNDIEGQDTSVNWRVNGNAFVVRKKAWEETLGFDTQFETLTMAALDFGFNLLRNYKGIPLYVKGLYSNEAEKEIKIERKERYRFFLKNFKSHHAFYMVLRKGLLKFPAEFITYKSLKKKIVKREQSINISIKELKPISGNPTVSLVIPTMKRQKFTQILLEDHEEQTYKIKEAIIVDATPEEERDDQYYKNEDFSFEVKVKWQITKGSCRARNEAVDLCSGDYIIFADDDIRIQPTFVENHIRLLQTYGAGACNGLDVMAENIHQDLDDLNNRLKSMDHERWRVGISASFSNANSCVKKEIAQELIGNDINFDGGYGEDSDYGLRILKKGYLLLHNPFSPNLHLKPPQGGYRWWGKESKKKGKQRKKQPWELDRPVKYIRPIPSPTISYGILKHFPYSQLKEWRFKYFFTYVFKGDKKSFAKRILTLPLRLLQFSKSLSYAKSLIKLGPRYK